MILREYQSQAVDAIFKEWQNGNKSTLLVLPTGMGKTICFAEVIKRIYPQRVLVLAHREELIWQAKSKIENHTGFDVDVEMGELRSANNYYNRSQVIVSTVQTQTSGKIDAKRMQKFNPKDFGLVIIDECHRSTANSYKKILDYYQQNPNLLVLGVTATPDRTDEEALGQIFQSVAFDYEILDAIHEGWLVPIHQKMVSISGLDFSSIRTTLGDLNGSELAQVMEQEKNLQGIASSAIEIIGDKRTLVFAASVRQAEMLCEIFNRHKINMADWICGDTPKDKRAQSLKNFSDGTTQVIVNVAVLTEGYDNPAVEVVVQAFKTKSRSKYSQTIGRATRPLPGIVDGLSTAEERKAAIANSAKPSMLVVDFTGNSGKHKLINTADILGGKVSQEAIERAIRKAEKSGESVNMTEALDKAQEDIEAEAEERRRLMKERKQREAAKRLNLIVKANYESKNVDPFNVYDISRQRERGWDQGKKLSPKQRDIILRQGVNPDTMTYCEGRVFVGEFFRRLEKNLATYKQCKLLKKHGYETKEITKKQASDLIDKLARNNWKRPD